MPMKNKTGWIKPMRRVWTPTADLVIKNVTIYTVALTIEEIKAGKTEFPIIRNGFVAAKDGRTIAIGTQLDNGLIGNQTEIVDGTGLTLVPGFVDSHLHALGAGIEQLTVSFEGVTSKQELLTRLKDRADQTPKGDWISGAGWNELVWDVKSAPTRYDLDAVSKEHPVVCTRLCHHVMAVNSAALALAGVSRATPDPEGGIIGRDNDGEPNGLLYENSAMELIYRAVPPIHQSQLTDAIVSIGKTLNANGVTACIDANLEGPMIRAYQQAYLEGCLSYRCRMMVYLDKARGDASYHLKRIEELPALTGYGNDILKYNGLKITLDGIPATGTACMRAPYAHMPETSGSAMFTRPEIEAIVHKAAECRWQVGIHCCGDLSADIAIKAYADTYADGREDLRHYIIHHAVVQPDQFPLLRKFSIPVTSQPAIGLLMGEQCLIGTEMAGRYLLGRTYFENGIIFGGSSDFPVVPCSPLMGMYAAVTRIGADGNVWNERERLTPAQALIMWTKNSAYFSHDDDVMGSIEVGNFADYVLLDTPILEVEPEKIKETKVIRTVVGGKTVYESDQKISR
jgi:predicted amidohydrolase YtcJ